MNFGLYLAVTYKIAISYLVDSFVSVEISGRIFKVKPKYNWKEIEMVENNQMEH